MVVCYVNAWPVRQAKCWSIFVCCQIAKLNECTTLTVLALTYVEKYWILKFFINSMNDAHFAKVFPKNACKYGETTTKDLFTLTLLSHLPNVYKFVKKKTRL